MKEKETIICDGLFDLISFDEDYFFSSSCTSTAAFGLRTLR